MRTFLRKTPMPSPAGLLIDPLHAPGVEYATVALYATSEIGAKAEILVPIASAGCRFLPLEGQVEVWGVIAPGHALLLSRGSHTVASAGPAFVPLWPRRYRNRPQRWPPLGRWAEAAARRPTTPEATGTRRERSTRRWR